MSIEQNVIGQNITPDSGAQKSGALVAADDASHRGAKQKVVKIAFVAMRSIVANLRPMPRLVQQDMRHDPRAHSQETQK